MLTKVFFAGAVMLSAPALGGYEHITEGCVNGNNIVLYSDKSVPECEQLCDADERCVAFEYGVAYGGGGRYKARDCQLQSSSNSANCDGAHHNLDLHVREPYQKFEQGCVYGKNIKLYTDKSVRECQNLCDDNVDCRAVEYGVAYEGGGNYKARDCQLQSSATRTGCNGGYYNLDLYVKPQVYRRFPMGCVLGQNLILYKRTSIETCKNRCDEREDCKAFEYGVSHGGSDDYYQAGDCQLQSSADYVGCDGFHYNLDLYAKESALGDQFSTDTYQKFPKGCVNGQNIKLFKGKSVQECKDLCDGNDLCKAIEYGVAYGGNGKYEAADCQLQSSSDRTGCDGAYHNLDLYVKSTYEHFPKGCVYGQNIILHKGKSVLECQQLCDARSDCMAIEYGVAYGGDGSYEPLDCQLQSSSYRSSCNGAHYNLDLYVKHVTLAPTPSPSPAPTSAPTSSPSPAPTDSPTRDPTPTPTTRPTFAPTTAGYQRFAKGCVNGNNIVLFQDMSLIQCQQLCDAVEVCMAIEYGVAYGGAGRYRAKDCQLQTSADRRNCDGGHHNLDLYVKGTYEYFSKSCVYGQNIVLYKNKSVAECQALCDARGDCLAVEYGVAYGGGGGNYQAGDCQLQSSAYKSHCNGAHYNLDLYVKGYGTQNSVHRRRLLTLEDSDSA